MQGLENILNHGKNSIKKTLGVLATGAILYSPNISLGQAIPLNNQGENSWNTQKPTQVMQVSQTGKLIGSEKIPIYFYGSIDEKNNLTIAYSITDPANQNPREISQRLNNTESRVWIVAPSCVEIDIESQKSAYVQEGEIQINELAPIEKSTKDRIIRYTGTKLNEAISEIDPTKKLSELPIVNLFIKKGFIETIEDKLVEQDTRQSQEKSEEGKYAVHQLPLWPSNAKSVSRILGIRAQVNPGYEGEKVPLIIYQRVATQDPNSTGKRSKLEVVANLEITNQYFSKEGKLDEFVGSWEMGIKGRNREGEPMSYLALQKKSGGYVLKIIDLREGKTISAEITLDNKSQELQIVPDQDNEPAMVFKRIPEKKFLDYQTNMQNKLRKEEEIRREVREEYENITNDEATIEKMQRVRIEIYERYPDEEPISSKLHRTRLKMAAIEMSSKLSPAEKQKRIDWLNRELHALNTLRERETK